ncbi:MAG TPA: alpha/beta hydrolase [Acidisphaera sp.]|nr:alpha/beta hydrolase [Acidisphaera sp.]
MEEGDVPYLLNGVFRRMNYVAWGDPGNDPVICLHGLTRTGRDFDALAQALSGSFFVICPDLPGRGTSEWLPTPALYQPATYIVAIGHLLAAIQRPVMWIGTSLGGIVGMAIAAAERSPVTRLVLNDVGPMVPQAGLRRIREQVAEDMPEFDDMAELEAHLRRIHAAFAPMTDADWAHLARISARVLPDGRLTLHYDPKIADPIKANNPSDTDLWQLWAAIKIPVLAIRGAQSDVLLPETLARMAQGGAQTMEVAGAGHAPSLMDAPTIERIRAFLTG